MRKQLLKSVWVSNEDISGTPENPVALPLTDNDVQEFDTIQGEITGEMQALESAEQVIGEMEKRIEESESKLGATVGSVPEQDNPSQDANLENNVQESQEEDGLAVNGGEASESDIQDQVLENEKSMESWAKLLGFNGTNDIYQAYGIERKSIGFESILRLPRESLVYSTEGIKEAFKTTLKVIKDMLARIGEWLSKSFQILFRAIFSYEKALESLKKEYKKKIEGRADIKLKEGTKFSPLTIILQSVNLTPLTETGVRFTEVLAKAQAWANTTGMDIVKWTEEVSKFIGDVSGDYKMISKKMLEGFEVHGSDGNVSHDDVIVLGIYGKSSLYGYTGLQGLTRTRIPRMTKIEISYKDGDFKEFNEADGKSVAMHLGAMIDSSSEYIKNVKSAAKEYEKKSKANIESIRRLSYFKSQPGDNFLEKMVFNGAERQIAIDPDGFIRKQMAGNAAMLSDISRLGRIYQTSPGLIITSIKEVLKSLVIGKGQETDADGGRIIDTVEDLPLLMAPEK